MPQDLFRLGQPLHLGGVVADRFLQRGDAIEGGLVAGRVRIEELVLPGQKETAHPGFHVDGRADDAVGFAQHGLGVADPAACGQNAAEHDDGDHAQYHEQGKRRCRAQQDLGLGRQISEPHLAYPLVLRFSDGAYGSLRQLADVVLVQIG